MATIDLSYSSKHSVNTDQTITKLYYSSSDSVTNPTDQVFKIRVDSGLGFIRGISFESSSTDCDIWLSESEDAAKFAIETVVAIDSINLGAQPSLGEDVYFKNLDTTFVEFLYFTISNQDAGNPTGAWELALVTGKK
jgi:hypothetical protein